MPPVIALGDLTEAGILYSFGDNGYWQLGLGHEHSADVPRQVAIEAVASVSAGFYHTAAITREGRLFTWGYNEYGQLGHGDINVRSVPTAVASIAHLTVKQVTAGDCCTLVIDAEGSIWTTGKLRVEGPSSNTFERIDFLDTLGLQQPLRFEQVSCTYCRLAVTTGGTLFSWGHGKYGQLGHGSTENIDVPRLVRALEGMPMSPSHTRR